jgi:hypothetical protein
MRILTRPRHAASSSYKTPGRGGPGRRPGVEGPRSNGQPHTIALAPAKAAVTATPPGPMFINYKYRVIVAPRQYLTLNAALRVAVDSDLAQLSFPPLNSRAPAASIGA